MHFNKIKSIIIIALSIFNLSSCSNNPQIKRIGVSLWIENDDFDQNYKGFIDGLKLGGYEAGKNIEILVENPQGNMEKHIAAVKSFQEQKVNLIFTRGTSASQAVSEYASNVPLIFSIVTFPQAAGIIKYADEASNMVAGTSNRIAIDSQYKIFSNLIPTLRSIAFVRSKEGQPNSKIQYEEFKEYLSSKGIEVLDYAANNINEIIEQLSKDHKNYDVIYGSCDAIVQAGGEEKLAKLANKYSKPSFACNKSAVTHGFLAALVADYYEIGKDAGIKAAQILDKPKTKLFSSDIASPILHINTKVSSKLNISIPETLQRQININYFPSND